MSNQLNRITIDPGVRFGRPCIRDTRFAVEDVLGYLAAGETRKTLLVEFDFLKDEDITAALEYAQNTIIAQRLTTQS
jgi:uncharacterized protein (DUF433 family)